MQPGDGMDRGSGRDTSARGGWLGKVLGSQVALETEGPEAARLVGGMAATFREWGRGGTWEVAMGCARSLGLLLPLSVPLDPSCSGLVLPPHRVQPGGLDAPKRSRLFPTLSHTQMGTDPLSSSVGQGTRDS